MGAAESTPAVSGDQRAGGLGLSEREARERRARGLGNRTTVATSRTYRQIVQQNLLTFLNLTLIAIGGVLIAMGEVKDAILASGLAVVNGLVGIVLETRAKRRLDRIALLGRATATVIRDGRERAIDPDEVVVGDVLVMRPGDQVIVDGRVVGEGVAEVDESLLTGEADPIRKQQGDTVASGSYCVSGMARYEAEKVGAESLAASMAAGARAFKVSLTPLQQNINLIIRLLLVIAGFLLVLILLGATIWDYPFHETVLAAAVVLGIVPSGLFLMITVAYATGAIRLAAHDALIQQTNAVESLSNVDVFCMDKTGTLTANKLALAELRPLGVDEATVRGMLGTFAAQRQRRDEDERGDRGGMRWAAGRPRRRDRVFVDAEVERGGDRRGRGERRLRAGGAGDAGAAGAGWAGTAAAGGLDRAGLPGPAVRPRAGGRRRSRTRRTRRDCRRIWPRLPGSASPTSCGRTAGRRWRRSGRAGSR